MKCKIGVIFFCISLVFCAINAQTDKTVGICLSGGGALGYAHIGALQALEEAGIKPNIISANSMGSVIGVFYANGYSPTEMLEVIRKEKGYRVRSIMDIRAKPKGGYLKHKQLQEVLDKYIHHNSFDSLNIEFYICCINIRKAEVKFVGKGNQLKEYVIASSSLPLVYEYSIIDGVEYVDGGLKNNFPVEPLVDAKCDKIIGINVINFTPADTCIKADELIPNIYAIMDEAINEKRYQQCDFYIPIKGLNTRRYNMFSYKHYMDIYRLGYENMKKYIEENPEILQ